MEIKTKADKELLEKIRKRLLAVDAVAALCDCSERHVYRLSDAGKMPRPLKLGALVRWNRAEIESWISQGCPPVRTVKRGAR